MPDQPANSTNPWVKPLLLITVVLILPLLLLAVWGEAFLSVAEQWKSDPPDRWVIGVSVIAILASDVFLPIPSGPISTLAGSQLGILLGTVVSTLGMTMGAAIAFALAKAWGRPLAERYSSAERLTTLESACNEHGEGMLILTRPLPILAEACALLVGTLQMPWRKFLPPVIASNSLIAFTYSALGKQAANYGWLPIALCLSIALPVLGTTWWRRRLKSST